MQDPIAFLDHAGDDWEIAVQVVQQAMELRAEEHREMLKAAVEGLGKVVGNAVADQLGRMFR